MEAAYEQSRLMSYLLGELSEPEETQLEQQYLRDKALHQELLLAEDELIESFLRNELPAEKRGRFESHFLASPVRYQRLESARAMLRAVDTEAPSLASDRRLMTSSGLIGVLSRLLAYRVPVPVLAATALLLCAGLVFLALRLQTAREQFRVERASRLQQQEDFKRQLTEKRNTPPNGSERQNAEKQPSLESAPAIKHLASVVLTQGQAREAGKLKHVVLSAESQLLLLYLVLPETANIHSYRATIKTPEGKALWTQSNLPLSAIEGKRSATLLVESQQLKSGDYVVTLLGANPAGQEQELADYVLRIARDPAAR